VIYPFLPSRKRASMRMSVGAETSCNKLRLATRSKVSSAKASGWMKSVWIT
jgi:hypothetical protein